MGRKPKSKIVEETQENLEPKAEKQVSGEETKVVDVKAEIRKLSKRGREQGFVTQEEILAIFPQPENSINEIEIKKIIINH